MATQFKDEYVYGNAARNRMAAPEYYPDREIEKIRKRRRKAQKIRRANWQNFLYTMVVIGITAVVFTLCVQYLQLRSDIKNNTTTIVKLQDQLEDITVKNDEAQVSADTSIDYSEIYNTAVKELGMVYPGAGQVVTYDAGVSEYVRQYKDIPEAK